MKRFLSIVSCLLSLSALCAACDLQPKIASVPDSIGEFISARYPAMLADPETQPEIYNSAALDYGTYADASIYGTNTNPDDYTQYSSIDDYAAPVKSQSELSDAVENINYEPPAASPAPLQIVSNDYLKIPDYERAAALSEITVAAGDTLYSLSRKYEIPVNDLAVMNHLGAPFALSVGQKLKVPKKEPATAVGVPTAAGAPTAVGVPVATATANDSLPAEPEKPKTAAQNYGVVPASKPSAPANQPSAAVKPLPAKPVAAPARVSSAPVAKLPAMSARAGSKFSWPVRGKILSGYGDKGNGLFNDGINIKAASGATVAASENGVVAYAGNELKGMGNLVIVQHSGGWMTVYGHLDSMNVRRGAKVSLGQKIGTVGQTGKVSEPQLHFEIRKGTKAYDPSGQLKK